jgi:hypothetical protein
MLAIGDSSDAMTADYNCIAATAPIRLASAAAVRMALPAIRALLPGRGTTAISLPAAPCT